MSHKQKTLLRLLIHTLILVPIYFVLPVLGFRYIHYLYLALGVGLTLWFVIYNKGFVYKNLTPDQLSSDLTVAERTALIEKMQKRFEKSKIALTFIVPIIFTFLLDAMYLFVLPLFEGWF